MSFDKQRMAHRMKVLRAEHSMTQDDLAKASGLNIVTIARYETAGRGMTLDSAVKLADALCCSIDELAGRESIIN